MGHGLGPDGKGHKFPIKTVLKQDRKCLGQKEQSKPKVTHFAANDARSVEQRYAATIRIQREKTQKKKHQTKKLSRENKREMDFRRDFYVND